VARDEQLVAEIWAWLKEIDEHYDFPPELGFAGQFEAEVSKSDVCLGQILMKSSPLWLTDRIINSQYDCFYTDDSKAIRTTLEMLKGLMDFHA
jgi:hypothetical protein